MGRSIPSIIRWTKTRTTVRKLNHYYKQISSIYDDDGKLDENDIKSLDRLKKDISYASSKGKIKDEHYNSLKEEISIS